MRRLVYIPIYLVLVLFLGACTQAIGAVKFGIQTDAEFNELVLADVQVANLLAQQTNDTLAILCWEYLEKFTVANKPDVEIPAELEGGVFTAYQKVRNVRRTVIEVEISDQFRLACGPMLTDSMGALGRLGVRLAL